MGTDTGAAGAMGAAAQPQLSPNQIIAIKYELKKIHARLLAVQNVLENMILIGPLKRLYIIVISTRDLLAMVAKNIMVYSDKINKLITMFYQLLLNIMRQVLLYSQKINPALQQQSNQDDDAIKQLQEDIFSNVSPQ